MFEPIDWKSLPENELVEVDQGLAAYLYQDFYDAKNAKIGFARALVLFVKLYGIQTTYPTTIGGTYYLTGNPNVTSMPNLLNGHKLIGFDLQKYYRDIGITFPFSPVLRFFRNEPTRDPQIIFKYPSGGGKYKIAFGNSGLNFNYKYFDLNSTMFTEKDWPADGDLRKGNMFYCPEFLVEEVFKGLP